MQLDELKKDLTDLKESIDPDKKNEILTVARLGDKYDFIMSRIESLEKEFEEEKNVTEKIVQRNYELLASQVDRIIDLMKWLGLLLIPLLFSAVRDLFGRKKEDGKPPQHKEPSAPTLNNT